MSHNFIDQGVWENAVHPKLEWNEYCDKNRSSTSEIWNIVHDMGDSSVPFTLVDWLIIFAMFEIAIIPWLYEYLLLVVI